MRQVRKSIFLIVSLVAVSSFLAAAVGQQAHGKDRIKANKMMKEMLAARERQGDLDNLLKADDHCLGRTSWRCRHISD